MAITGIDTIEGKQIIAAGAVSAKSAEMAYNDENGNPITGYLTAVPEGYATTADLTGKQDTLTFGYNESNAISSINESAIAGGGATPTYSYTDTDLISAIDSSGLYATSALEAKSANALVDGGRLGSDVYAVTGVGTNSTTLMILNPQTTPFGTTSGIYGPLYYAQGACMTYGSSAGSTQYFGGFFKGNEWYISNATAGQALRGETHASRGVHVSGATTAGYGFNLGILSVSGVNSTGSWKYGHAEDAALRAVSSCDMHESAFEYDASDNITAYNGSAFAGGSTLPSAFVVSADGQAYKSVPNVLTGVTGYFYDLGDIEYYTKFSNVQNNVQYTLDTHTYEYMSVYTITGDNKHVYIQAEYTDGDTHSFTLTNYNPSEGDVYVELFTDDYYGGEITLSADGNILKPYALKDEFPQSATEAIETVTANSADWNGTTDTVSSNSGAWGGSALPISAGPGIKLEMVDNTLVASVDETVLASGIANDATAFTLSEPAGNFERLRLYDTYGNIVEVAGDNNYLTWVFDRTNGNGTRMNRCYTITSTDGINWNELNVYGWNQTAYTGALILNGGTDWYLETHKIVGINRTAGE